MRDPPTSNFCLEASFTDFSAALFAVSLMANLKVLRSSHLVETPMNFSGPGRLYSGQFESVKSGGTIIKEQQVRSGPSRMPGVNAFVLAVQDPEPIEHRGHARDLGRFIERVKYCLPIVQRDAREWPNVSSTGTAIDTIPAIDEKLFARAGGNKGPGLGTLGVASRGGIKRVNRRQSGWAAEHGTCLGHFVIPA